MKNVWRVFASLKRSATLPQITQTGELIVKVTLHGKILRFRPDIAQTNSWS
jgi:hypothetical protein